MKLLRNWLLITFGTFSLISGKIVAQTQGKAFLGDTETQIIDFKAAEYKLQFPIKAEEIKTAYMAKMKNFQYVIEIYLEDAGTCSTEALQNWQETYPENSLANMAKNGELLSYNINGKELNSTINSELEQCGWPENDSKAILKLLVFSKSGKPMSIAKIDLTIPSNSNSKNLEEKGVEVYKFFTEGHASRNIKDTNLEKAVESYMENKWHSEDITTVHVTSIKYTNSSSTAFDIEGYYITKKADNSCKYNGFYGDGTKTSNNYSISTFNSMTAETSFDCGVANKLKNLE